MKTLEERIGMSIVRIADLAQHLKDNNMSIDKYKGVMYCLSILYSEFTGKELDGTWGPKEVYAWAMSLGQRGQVQ